jgi:hypothetical protein
MPHTESTVELPHTELRSPEPAPPEAARQPEPQPEPVADSEYTTPPPPPQSEREHEDLPAGDAIVAEQGRAAELDLPSAEKMVDVINADAALLQKECPTHSRAGGGAPNHEAIRAAAQYSSEVVGAGLQVPTVDAVPVAHAQGLTADAATSYLQAVVLGRRDRAALLRAKAAAAIVQRHVRAMLSRRRAKVTGIEPTGTGGDGDGDDEPRGDARPPGPRLLTLVALSPTFAIAAAVLGAFGCYYGANCFYDRTSGVPVSDRSRPTVPQPPVPQQPRPVPGTSTPSAAYYCGIALAFGAGAAATVIMRGSRAATAERLAHAATKTELAQWRKTAEELKKILTA